jgi:hypothetical protein
MKRILGLLVIATTLSCGKYDFENQLQGKWEVSEIRHISEEYTYLNTNPNMFFEFENNNYTTKKGTDSIIETGTFFVNPKVTQISFYTDLGNSTFIIQEHSDQFQTWRSKHKIIDFYLQFKLNKLE